MQLSIITVNLNNLEGLKRTLQSIVEQTYRDFEWIVVDGDSTDGSREYMEQNKQYTSHYISEKDTGIYNAMNKGIRFAKGEYLLFLNSGDWFSNPNILSDIFQQAPNSDIFFGRVTMHINWGVYTMGQSTANFSVFSLLTIPIAHQATFYRKVLIDKYGSYDESFYLAGDVDFNFRCIVCKKCSVKYLDIIVADCDGDGLSSHPKKDISNDRNRIIRKNLPRLIGRDLPNPYWQIEVEKAIRLWKRVQGIPFLKWGYRLLIKPLIKQEC